MSGYIRKDVAREYLEKACFYIGGNGGLMLKLKFDEEPTADVRENKHGEWIKYGDKYKCNKCFATMQVNPINPKLKDRFCYFCGSDMQKEVEE